MLCAANPAEAAHAEPVPEICIGRLTLGRLQPARVHALGGQGIPPSSAAASIVKADSQLSSMAEFVVISIGAVQVRVRRG
jgi:hypothetical protein